MEFSIYNKEGIKIDILQNTTSVQWTRRYNETGNFEIHAINTKTNRELLQIGNRIVNNATNEIGFITYVFPINYTISGDEELEIRGELNNLSDRINPNTRTIRNVEQGIYDLVNANKRGLDITTDTVKGLSETIPGGKDTTWQELRETVEELCKGSRLGFRQVRKNGKMNVLEIYKRGIKNEVKFSDEIGNIISQSYLRDITNYKNYLYIACQGKAEQRIVYEMDLRKPGDSRKELYVDGRHLSWEYEDSKGNQQTYTEQQYRNNAIKYGMQIVAEYADIKEFTCNINSSDTLFKFREEYDLGDVVKTISKMYGISSFFRISEINEIQEDEETYSIKLTEYEDEQENLLMSL